MNDTSLADEISIRDLQLSRRSQGNLIDDLQRASREHWDRIQHQARQIHDLMQRLERLEKREPQDALNRRLKALDEKAFTVGLTCEESDERTWLVKRISLMMGLPTVGNAYTSHEGWDAKQKAVESKCGHDQHAQEEIRDAHRLLNTYQIPEASCLRERIEHLRFLKLPKWRDAKTDPPKADSGRFLTWQMGIHLVAFYNRLDSPGRRWTINGNDCTSAVTHWQELPAPPQATEKA